MCYDNINFEKFLIVKVTLKVCFFIFVLFFVYSSCFVCIIYFIYSLSKKDFFAYICNIIGRTPDDAKVFGEIY